MRNYNLKQSSIDSFKETFSFFCDVASSLQKYEATSQKNEKVSLNGFKEICVLFT